MNPMKARRLCAAGCGRHGAKAARIYCSTKCQHQVANKQRYMIFLSGNYPPLVSNARAFRQLVVRYLGKEACTRCGWAKRHPITGRIPVELEHIDGDWRNNRPDNVTLLCPSCHALTPTYRSLNRGRGRAERSGGRANPLRRKRGTTEGRRSASPKKPAALEEPEKQLRLNLPT